MLRPSGTVDKMSCTRKMSTKSCKRGSNVKQGKLSCSEPRTPSTASELH